MIIKAGKDMYLYQIIIELIKDNAGLQPIIQIIRSFLINQRIVDKNAIEKAFCCYRADPASMIPPKNRAFKNNLCVPYQ